MRMPTAPRGAAAAPCRLSLGTFSMQPFYDTVRKLKRGAWMSKPEAFRAVPLSEDQWELLITFLAGPGSPTWSGSSWPAWATRTSPPTWTTFSDEDKCNAALDALNTLLQKLGFQVEASKVERVTRRIAIRGLGITTDAANDGTNVMEAHVPEDNVNFEDGQHHRAGLRAEPDPQLLRGRPATDADGKAGLRH